MKLKQKFENVFFGGKRIYTKTKYPISVYGESLVKYRGKVFRQWDPRRSKLGASILKGLSDLGFNSKSKVLYLGSASGTTVSHVSDIVQSGIVFALDFAPRVMRDLLNLVEIRDNIIPLFFDAAHPEEYFKYMTVVDFIFQDVAQRNQVEIFLKNIKAFLKTGGFAMLSLKSRSIDVARKPKEIFKEVRNKLKEELRVQQVLNLSPYEQDHALFFCQKTK